MGGSGCSAQFMETLRVSRQGVVAGLSWYALPDGVWELDHQGAEGAGEAAT